MSKPTQSSNITSPSLEPTTFRIPGTPTNLTISAYLGPIDKSQLRYLLFDAIAEINSVIAIYGDSPLHDSEDPYEASRRGTGMGILIGSPTNDAGVRDPILQWSIVRNVLVGLRQHLVNERRWVGVTFSIFQDGIGYTGVGTLAKEELMGDLAMR